MYGDWVLNYPGEEYKFGPPRFNVELVNFEIGTDSYRVDDTPNDRGDGMVFGQDFLEPGEIKINVKIDFTTYPAPVEQRAQRAWDTAQELYRVWRADALRRTSGAVATLNMGGEVLVSGRPRRSNFDYDVQNVGLVYGSLYFIPSSTNRYAIDEDGNQIWNSVEVGLIPSQIGGIVAPLKAPITTARASDRSSQFEVPGGNSHFTLEVFGPIQSGWSVELIGHWVLESGMALNYDDSVKIETDPDNAGTYWNGSPRVVLKPNAPRLTTLVLPNGWHELAFRGTSIEGTARAVLSWKETRTN